MIYLSDDYRVRPLDHLQWALELRMTAGASGRKHDHVVRKEVNTEAWRVIAYCRTRVGLETALSRLRCDRGVHLDPKLIAHLPDFYEPTP